MKLIDLINKLLATLQQGEKEIPELTVADLIMLGKIAQSPQIMTTLAREAGFSTAACTGRIDRLHDMGLVRRMHDKEDRRKIFVVLTQTGEDFVERLSS